MKKRRRRILFVIVIILVVVMVCKMVRKTEVLQEEQEENKALASISTEHEMSNEKNKSEFEDWRLVLVNYEHALPSDFKPDLVNIDKIRQFDARAIGELKQMMEQMQQDGITNVWVQSAYRSIEHQDQVFEQKVKKYMAQGKSREEAENLVLQTINKPGTSEHNLGLAIDFNYVDYSFDETAGFEWLKENAEKYGFVLRYAKEKEKITKVDYEPWHWRYVGEENAIKMNELEMCLEEYVEYLKQ